MSKPRPLSAAAMRARDYLSNCIQKGMIEETLWSEPNALDDFFIAQAERKEQKAAEERAAAAALSGIAAPELAVPELLTKPPMYQHEEDKYMYERGNDQDKTLEEEEAWLDELTDEDITGVWSSILSNHALPLPAHVLLWYKLNGTGNGNKPVAEEKKGDTGEPDAVIADDVVPSRQPRSSTDPTNEAMLSMISNAQATRAYLYRRIKGESSALHKLRNPDKYVSHHHHHQKKGHGKLKKGGEEGHEKGFEDTNIPANAYQVEYPAASQVWSAPPSSTTEGENESKQEELLSMSDDDVHRATAKKHFQQAVQKAALDVLDQTSLASTSLEEVPVLAPLLDVDLYVVRRGSSTHSSAHTMNEIRSSISMSDAKREGEAADEVRLREFPGIKPIGPSLPTTSWQTDLAKMIPSSFDEKKKKKDALHPVLKRRTTITQAALGASREEEEKEEDDELATPWSKVLALGEEDHYSHKREPSVIRLLAEETFDFAEHASAANLGKAAPSSWTKQEVVVHSKRHPSMRQTSSIDKGVVYLRAHEREICMPDVKTVEEVVEDETSGLVHQADSMQISVAMGSVDEYSNDSKHGSQMDDRLQSASNALDEDNDRGFKFKSSNHNPIPTLPFKGLISSDSTSFSPRAPQTATLPVVMEEDSRALHVHKVNLGSGLLSIPVATTATETDSRRHHGRRNQHGPKLAADTEDYGDGERDGDIFPEGARTAGVVSLSSPRVPGDPTSPRLDPHTPRIFLPVEMRNPFHRAGFDYVPRDSVLNINPHAPHLLETEQFSPIRVVPPPSKKKKFKTETVTDATITVPSLILDFPGMMQADRRQTVDTEAEAEGEHPSSPDSPVDSNSSSPAAAAAPEAAAPSSSHPLRPFDKIELDLNEKTDFSVYSSHLQEGELSMIALHCESRGVDEPTREFKVQRAKPKRVQIEVPGEEPVDITEKQQQEAITAAVESAKSGAKALTAAQQLVSPRTRAHTYKEPPPVTTATSAKEGLKTGPDAYYEQEQQLLARALAYAARGVEGEEKPTTGSPTTVLPYLNESAAGENIFEKMGLLHPDGTVNTKSKRMSIIASTPTPPHTLRMDEQLGPQSGFKDHMKLEENTGLELSGGRMFTPVPRRNNAGLQTKAAFDKVVRVRENALKARAALEEKQGERKVFVPIPPTQGLPPRRLAFVRAVKPEPEPEPTPKRKRGLNRPKKPTFITEDEDDVALFKFVQEIPEEEDDLDWTGQTLLVESNDMRGLFIPMILEQLEDMKIGYHATDLNDALDVLRARKSSLHFGHTKCLFEYVLISFADILYGNTGDHSERYKREILIEQRMHEFILDFKRKNNLVGHECLMKVKWSETYRHFMHNTLDAVLEIQLSSHAKHAIVYGVPENLPIEIRNMWVDALRECNIDHILTGELSLRQLQEIATQYEEEKKEN